MHKDALKYAFMLLLDLRKVRQTYTEAEFEMPEWQAMLF